MISHVLCTRLTKLLVPTSKGRCRGLGTGSELSPLRGVGQICKQICESFGSPTSGTTSATGVDRRRELCHTGRTSGTDESVSDPTDPEIRRRREGSTEHRLPTGTRLRTCLLHAAPTPVRTTPADHIPTRLPSKVERSDLEGFPLPGTGPVVRNECLVDHIHFDAEVGAPDETFRVCKTVLPLRSRVPPYPTPGPSGRRVRVGLRRVSPGSRSSVLRHVLWSCHT